MKTHTAETCFLYKAQQKFHKNKSVNTSLFKILATEIYKNPYVQRHFTKIHIYKCNFLQNTSYNQNTIKACDPILKKKKVYDIINIPHTEQK